MHPAYARHDECVRFSNVFIDSEAGKRHLNSYGLNKAALLYYSAILRIRRHASIVGNIYPTARKILKQHAAEEFATIGARYGKRSLLNLAITAEFFEVQRKTSPGGGTAIARRVASCWTLQSSGRGSGDGPRCRGEAAKGYFPGIIVGGKFGVNRRPNPLIYWESGITRNSTTSPVEFVELMRQKTCELS